MDRIKLVELVAEKVAAGDTRKRRVIADELLSDADALAVPPPKQNEVVEKRVHRWADSDGDKKVWKFTRTGDGNIVAFGDKPPGF